MVTRQQSNDLEAAPLQSKYDFSFICQTLKKSPICHADQNRREQWEFELQYIFVVHS